MVDCLLTKYGEMPQVSLVSKDSPMLDGLDTASIEMEEAKVLSQIWCSEACSIIYSLR